jgi:hypothetical protein
MTKVPAMNVAASPLQHNWSHTLSWTLPPISDSQMADRLHTHTVWWFSMMTELHKACNNSDKLSSCIPPSFPKQNISITITIYHHFLLPASLNLYKLLLAHNILPAVMTAFQLITKLQYLTLLVKSTNNAFSHDLQQTKSQSSCDFFFKYVHKIAKATISFSCLSAWNNSAHTGQILMKFDKWVFLKNQLRKFKFH